MHQSFKYILFLIFLQLSITVVAQNYTLSYKAIDNETGVLGGRVNSFYEDKDGFIWLGTPKGIARYDGHQFKWLTLSNSRLRGIPGADKFAEDDEGNLWVFSFGKIDLINTQTFEIQPLEEKLGKELTFNGNFQVVIHTDDHYIFFNCRNKTTSKWYKYRSDIGLVMVDFIPKDTYSATPIGDNLWLQPTDNTKPTFVYNYKTEQKVYEDSELIYPIPTPSLGKAIVYKSTHKKLELFEFVNDSLKSIFKHEIPVKRKPPFMFMNYLPEHKIFVTNFNAEENGLSIVDIKNQRLLPITNSKQKNIFLNKKTWINRQGIIFMPRPRNILMLQIKPTYFQQYPPYKSYRGIRVLGDYLYGNKHKISLSNPNDIQTRKENFTIWGVDNNLKDQFLASNQHSVGEIDATTNSIKNIIPYKGNPLMWSILKSQKGQWWIGSYKEGLFVSNFPKNDSILLFDKFNGFEELRDIRVNHIMEDGDYIWASSLAGLFLIHKEKGVLQRYSPMSSYEYQLPVNDVYFLYKDAAENYWLATSSEGLIHFKVNEKFEVTEYKRYTEEDGLSSNILYAIQEDDKKRLWISTYNGISCFDKKTANIQAFTKEDGIYELEFNRNSYTKAADGRLFFGSLKGITAFYPDEVIKSKSYNASIFITQFFKYKKNNNEEIDQTLQVQQTQKIVIQPSERFFRLNVAMLDIFHANKLRYSYKVEGLFKDYQSIEGNNIEIGGLPYGRYQLKIRGQGADNRFSSEVLMLELIAVRPFYLRWWFILFALVLVGVSAFQAYQWRIRQLQERKRELELLVEERTAQIRKDKAIIEQDKETIEEQAIQLKELDELKSKFFANISHELRTPLTLLLAPMESIMKSKELSNRNFTYLQMMRQNGQKLLKRINELLDLSRLDANRLEVNEQPTFLYPFFKTLLSSFESAANFKGIELLFKYQLDKNIKVKLDDDKVEKIISNYLSNALKFTPKNGEIEIQVTNKKDKILISVRDTGIGILPNDLIKIFDRFYQSKTEKQQQGSGIGLSLCRELAKVLGGRVWATSEIDEGSIFYLELPLVETFALKEEQVEENLVTVPIASETEPNHTISNHYRPNILIVEDNPDLRQFLTMILEKDYNVEAVENGEEALEQLRVASSELPVDATTNNSQLATRNWQLIISDIMMPIMDGIELLTKVKNTKELQHIPMIMLTARQSVEVKIEALRIGVDDYLTKPFREEELKARVANLIRNSQNRSVVTNEEEPTNSAQKVTSPADLVWLKELEAILEDNIGNSHFKISDAARQMAVSPRRLQQKIKQITGLTPKKYQRSILLHRARAILKSGQVRTVQEIVYQMGFDNRHYFSKIYQEEFGIRPSEDLK